MPNPSDLQNTKVSVPVARPAERPERVSRESAKTFDSPNHCVLGQRYSSLIKQAAEGDAEALTLLLRAARPVIYGWASQMTGDPDEAEDITQAVLVRVWGSLPGFRGDSRISSWLFRITANQVSENRRREKAQLTKARAWAAQCPKSQNPFQPPSLDLSGFVESVRAVALDLPPVQRATFKLVALDGYKPCEAARELGKTQTTIRSTLCRARKKVRERVQKGAEAQLADPVALAS